MHYKIEQTHDYLRADLCERETVEETQEFIKALTAKAAQYGCTRVLVCVRNSRPVFKLGAHGINGYFRQMAANPANRVALVSDSEELRSSQQYIEMLGREQGAKVKAFRDEPSALAWLRSAP
jgi:hypothetical protein